MKMNALKHNPTINLLAILIYIVCFALGACYLEGDIELLRPQKAHPTYTVTFNANGAIGAVPPAQTVIEGSRILLPDGDGLSRDELVFGGWNTQGNGTGDNYLPGSSFTVIADIILYAQWDNAMYTVTFDANRADGDVPAARTETKGSTIPLPDKGDLSLYGLVFGGWNTQANGTGTNYDAASSYTVTADITLYAQWEINNTALAGWLDSQSEGSVPSDPIPLALNINLGNSDNLADLIDAIGTAGKYVELDLSACTGTIDFTLPNLNPDNSDPNDENRKWITEIVLPDSITNIGNWAFSGCNNLTGVTIPDGVTSIGDRAFSACHSLSDITIPKGVTGIGAYTFSDCSSLTHITIPDGVTGIGYAAFSGCSNLTGVSIPNGVTSIGDYAFWRCNLISVAIPGSVTGMGSNSFSQNFNLTVIQVDIDNTAYCSIDGALYTKDQTKIARYPAGKLGTVTIPDSVTGIGDAAFSYCNNLTNITIPDGVTGIGDAAFSNCNDLANITIPDSVTSIGDAAFTHCARLRGITIPDGVTGIGKNTFTHCAGLTGITIPDSVTGIGNEAFNGCTSLTTVTFAGTISGENFSAAETFPGNLRDKFLAEGIGTYTREEGGAMWTKQD